MQTLGPLPSRVSSRLAESSHRRDQDRIEWIGIRHEKVAAFAANAQSQLSGTIGVCMGTVRPGSIQLLNGLHNAKKSHTPLLVICGQVPSAEIGTEFFREVNNDRFYADVAVFTQTITIADQQPLAGPSA